MTSVTEGSIAFTSNDAEAHNKSKLKVAASASGYGYKGSGEVSVGTESGNESGFSNKSSKTCTRITFEKAGGEIDSDDMKGYKTSVKEHKQEWVVLWRNRAALVAVWDIIANKVNRGLFKNPIKVARCLLEFYRRITGLNPNCPPGWVVHEQDQDYVQKEKDVKTQGTLKMKGETYTGEVSGGKANGLGTLTKNLSGIKYTGPWVNDLKHGEFVI
jgi:hypothetical protein